MCSLLQNGFENIINEFTSKISNFHFHEIKTLKQQIEQQNAEIAKLHTAMQQLKETVSTLQTSNEDLKSKLQEKEGLLENLGYNSVFEEDGESFEICEEETSYKERISYPTLVILALQIHNCVKREVILSYQIRFLLLHT